MNPTPTLNNKFSFQKIYTELDYLAGGILMIPSGQQKPMKPAKDNSYVRAPAALHSSTARSRSNPCSFST